jgi:hypothetical protein
MAQPWRRALWLLGWGWMPVGIGWQLLNADQLDAYSMLGWFLWPAVPATYLAVALLIGQPSIPGTRRRGNDRPSG